MAATAFCQRFLSPDPAMVKQFGDPFRPLEPECEVIQLCQPLTPAHLRQAGDLIANRPDVQLYVYGRPGTDLDFLRYFGTVRRLHVALCDLDDITGYVPG
jgi:hypothetical protein